MSQLQSSADSAHDDAARQTRRFMTFAWAVFGITALVDLIWFPFTRLTFAFTNFLRAGVALLALGALNGIARAVLHRVDGDHSKIAAIIRHIAEGLKVLIRAAVFIVLLGFATITLVYLATSAGLPLQDERFAAFDRSLGFDWISYLTVTNSSPILSSILVWAYHSAGPQLSVLYLLLSFTNREVRLAEFLALAALTLLVVGCLACLFPAIGATAYYRPDPSLLSHFGLDSGMRHYEAFMNLRTEASPLVDFKIIGVVQFPSFHTVLAILTAYAVRDLPYVALPALVINLIVIAATLPEGGHHLADVIAGAAIAGVAIVIVRLHQSGWSLPFTFASMRPPRRRATSLKDKTPGLRSK
jgi:membrane-associated phospholipid phosphatase